MSDYVDSALFVYTEKSASYCENLQQNALGVIVTPVAFEALLQNPASLLIGADHVVVSGSMDFLKKMVWYAKEYDFSIGLITLPDQRGLARSLALPEDVNSMIDLALRKEAQQIDLIQCNEKFLFFKASIGRIPMIDHSIETSRVRVFLDGLKKLWNLKLLPFHISTKGDQTLDIQTAACGCMIFQPYKHSLASKLAEDDIYSDDGMISMILVAPFSVIDYGKFVFHTLARSGDVKHITNAIGYIKSPEIIIETEQPMQVDIDGEPATTTPLHIKVLPGALRINLGGEVQAVERKAKKVKEQIRIDALPAGKELVKARNRKIPFFTYASEERFKDLFVALRGDARMDVTFVVLIILSTVLATTGLYLDSASVIIGAMILAPLMAPIVSLAMGLLRQDDLLIRRSIGTIFAGILLALLTAAVLTLFFTYKPVTGEMLARLRPTVLDLIVAITAGIAGAYTKSRKEILQSLAGVAIAVALVPPLAVAGIGIGRLDPEFFGQAFLLFSTNLIGITLAATFTFRFLGFSPAVKSKRGIGVVICLLILIFIPLNLSYHQIVETRVFEQSWQEERFFVHGKYLIIKNAHLSEYSKQDILTIDIQAREQLTRADLTELKRKIGHNFSEDLVIRANITYIP